MVYDPSHDPLPVEEVACYEEESHFLTEDTLQFPPSLTSISPTSTWPSIFLSPCVSCDRCDEEKAKLSHSTSQNNPGADCDRFSLLYSSAPLREEITSRPVCSYKPTMRLKMATVVDTLQAEKAVFGGQLNTRQAPNHLHHKITR